MQVVHPGASESLPLLVSVDTCPVRKVIPYLAFVRASIRVGELTLPVRLPTPPLAGVLRAIREILCPEAMLQLSRGVDASVVD